MVLTSSSSRRWPNSSTGRPACSIAAIGRWRGTPIASSSTVLPWKTITVGGSGRAIFATPTSEARRGRYLRALYETEAPANRPERLFEAMQEFGDLPGDGPVMLEDLIRVSDRPLPDREPFLRAWMAFLREQESASADRWLREAIRLLEGTKGLAAFARKEGKAHPRAYLDWLTALQSEGKTAQVVTAAREALRALPADRPIRAAIADHLCEAARTLDDPETLQEGRWEAFTVKPSLGRLLDLWEATPESKRRTRMRQAERHLDQSLQRQTRRSVEEFDATVDDDLEAPAWVDRTLLAHARMLCGDWEAARAMAADADVLGWSSSDNPQGVVVPACLVLLSGQATAPPANLARLWDWALESSTFLSAYDERPEDQKRLKSVYQEVMSRVRLKEAQAESLLSWCVEVGERRACAIVEKLRRKSYDRAAVITAACAGGSPAPRPARAGRRAPRTDAHAVPPPPGISR